MDGSKDGTAHRSLHPQFMHKTAVQSTGVLRIGILGLLREGIGIQPRKKFQIQGQTHVPVLRCMDMQVIESRDKQFISKIHDLAPPVHVFRQFSIDPFDQTVGLHHNITVRNDLKMIRRRGIKDIRSIDFHFFLFLKKNRQMK